MIHPSPTLSDGAAENRARLALTARDPEVLELFRGIRFATTSQLAALLVPQAFPTAHRLRLRLGKLERKGFLDRPARRRSVKSRVEYELRSDARLRGRPEDIWALAQAGAKLLKLPGDWNRNNGRLRPGAFAHPLMVTKVFLTLAHAADRGLLDLEEWVGENGRRLRVVLDGVPRSLAPDGSFRLVDHRTEAEAPLVFLEADNHTEPLTRIAFGQSAFRTKCVLYWHHWLSAVRPQQGAMIVLVVAKTATWAESLRRTAKEADAHGRGLNLFWFTSEDRWTITAPEEFLYAPIWTTAAGEQRAIF